MPHEVELIATIAIGFALAFAFGFVAIRLGLPPLIGYLIAGVCIGPLDAGIRGRSRDCRAVGRNWCDSAHVRRWTSFFRGRPASKNPCPLQP